MSKERKPNYLKIIGLFLLGLILFIFAILVAAPAILSTQWGQTRLLKQVNEKIPGKITAQQIHLSWLGKQTIQDLSLKDDAGNEILSLQQFQLDSPLTSFFFKETPPLKATIQNLNASFKQEAGESTLLKALGIPTPAHENEDASYAVEAKNVQGEIQFISKNDPVTLRLSGQTQNGTDVGTFDIDMQLSGPRPEQIEKMTARISNLPVSLIEQLLSIKQQQWNQFPFQLLFGKFVSVDLEQVKNPEGMDLDFTIKSPNLSMVLNGELTPEKFSLKKAGTVDFVLNPPFFSHWLAKQGIQLQKATHLHLTVDNLIVPLEQFSDLGIQAKIDLPEADLYGVPGLKQTNLRRVQIHLNKEQLNPHVHLKAQGEENQGKVPAIFAFNGTVNHETQQYEAILTADPLHLKEIPGIGDVALQETRLLLSGTSAEDRKIQLTANVAPLSPNSPLATTSPVKITLHNQKGFQAAGHLEVDHLALGNPDSPTFLSLTGLNIPWQVDAINSRIHLSLAGHSQIGNSIATPISGEIAILNWIHLDHLTPDLISVNGVINMGSGSSDQYISGNWDRSNQFLALQGQLRQFPASIFYKLSKLEASRIAKLEAALGPIIDASFDIHLQHNNGPVKASIAGSRGAVHLDSIVKGDYLTLNSPFYAEVEASPALSETVLQELIPLLAGITRADDRLRIAIQPDGFLIPLSHITLNNIQIGQMAVELGNVYFDEYGQVATILRLLKVIPDEEFSVWFTPVYLSIQNGQVSIQRFDMLAMGNYPLAAWGNIDVPGNYINMRIGLSGRTLQQVLGVAIPDRDYMLQFPFTGPIGHARVDKSKVTAKLAALAAAATGPQGLVLGAVIGFASGAFSEDPIPHPTTNPLPWDLGADSSVQENSGSIPNPIKALQKGASSILKNIFR